MELSAVNLTKRYGSKTAVNRLNATLTNGVYGLLGTNGAGKTTFMRLLCTVQRPTSGKIDLDEVLDEVGLSGERRRKIKTFSGGMKQRLGIAQAMLNDPYILILDEPTAGLDPKERVRFRNLISAFSKDRIVILSTHIVSDIEFIAEKIMIMKSGEIIHFGRPHEITSRINGCVWECSVPTSRVEQYTVSLNISNLRNEENGRTVLRVIADQPPVAGAVKVQPNLEDLFLYYFKGEDGQ